MDTIITEKEKTKLFSAFKTIENILNKIQADSNSVRNGWSEAFKEMNNNGDDELLIPDVFEDEEII